LDSVYTQAPGINAYRTGSQLISFAQAVCSDLSAGASIEQVADRVPLASGSVALPTTDLGVVMTAAVNVFCPKFDKLLGE
jgi:hypothetical protein